MFHAPLLFAKIILYVQYTSSIENAATNGGQRALTASSSKQQYTNSSSQQQPATVAAVSIAAEVAAVGQQ